MFLELESGKSVNSESVERIEAFGEYCKVYTSSDVFLSPLSYESVKKMLNDAETQESAQSAGILKALSQLTRGQQMFTP